MFDRVVSTHRVVALNFLDYSVPGLFQRQYVHFELIDILSFVMWLRKELKLSFYWTLILWRVLWNHWCLFVCLSVSWAFSLRNWSLFFFWFFCAMVNDWTFINWQRPFSRKNHFCLNLGKKHPKWPQNRVLDTLKSFVISFSWK